VCEGERGEGVKCVCGGEGGMCYTPLGSHGDSLSTISLSMEPATLLPLSMIVSIVLCSSAVHICEEGWGRVRRGGGRGGEFDELDKKERI